MLIDSFNTFAFVGLGSNLNSAFGSPQDNVMLAADRLRNLSDEPTILSTLIISRPLDCPPESPDFVNAVVALKPKKTISPLDFLESLQIIENEIGRLRSGLKNEPRVIDLDLLVFKNLTHFDDKLSLPHPEILNRGFVLSPLEELLGNIQIVEFLDFVKKNSAKKRS